MWCSVDDVLARVPTSDTGTATRAVEHATAVLNGATGGRYGQRTLTLNHNRYGFSPPSLWFQAVDVDPSDWPLLLPADTVEVTAVTVDGLAVDPAEYRLGQRGRLHRTDGRAWPSGTVVTAVAGTTPPPAAQSACLTLAVEVAKAWKDSNSRLPRRMTEVRAPDGGTLGIVNSLDIVTRGGTGVPEVDAWLAAEGAFTDRRRTGSTMLSPTRYARTARIEEVAP